MYEDNAIAVVGTPNPDARMFRVGETLVPAGTYEYSSLDQTGSAPLGRLLLGIEEVALILVAPRFVTVRKHPEADWDTLEPRVLAALEHFLASGDMAVIPTSVPADDLAARSELEQRVVALLDDEVRPAIAQDGGDVEFHGIIDGIVQLRLVGACGTCPSSVSTLKFGIERLLMEEFPEIRGVEQIEEAW